MSRVLGTRDNSNAAVEPTAKRRMEDEDAGGEHDDLWAEDSPCRDAEQANGGGRRHEAERRLVDGHDAAAVEGGEEQVPHAVRPADVRSGVVRVSETVECEPPKSKDQRADSGEERVGVDSTLQHHDHPTLHEQG